MWFQILQILSMIFISAEKDSQSNQDILEKRILFHEETKILMAEKFISVQFLVPFPQYNFSMKPEIDSLLKRLNAMWSLPSISCPMRHSTGFETNASSFNIDWILEK